MKVKSSQVSSHWISSPSQVKSFSLFSQASHKSLNLRLESDSSQVMWLESPISGNYNNNNTKNNNNNKNNNNEYYCLNCQMFKMYLYYYF